MSENKQEKMLQSKKGLGIERVSLSEMTHSEFLLNVTRYAFAAQYLRAGQKVLDVACGTGYGVPFFKGAELLVLADISLDALKVAKSSYNYLNTCFIQCDAEHLPFKDASFDLITSFETIEHLKNPQLFLAELKRVAKRGARIIISTPNREYKAIWVRNINPYHVREWNIREFCSLVSKFFENVEVYAQIPPISQRIVDNLAWTIRKLIMFFPYPIASKLLQLGRKLKRYIFKSRQNLEKDFKNLSPNHSYNKPIDLGKKFYLKKPQTIVVVAFKK